MRALRIASLAFFISVFLSAPAMAGQLKDGIRALEHQDFDRARTLFEAYMDRFPTDPRPCYYLAECYKHDYLVPKVEEMLQAYRRRSERRDRILLTLEGAESASVYRDMLADDPQDLSARLLLVVSLLQGHATMMAEAELQALEHVDMPPELADKRLAMWGTLYIQEGEYGKARNAFREAWRLNPIHPLPPKRLPEIDAAEQAQQAPPSPAPSPDAASPQGYDLLFKLGQDLYKEGNYDGAIDSLNQAIAARPDSAEAKALLANATKASADAIYQQGLVLMSQQHYDAAIEAFQNALHVDPTHPKAAEMAGIARAQLNAMGPARSP